MNHEFLRMQKLSGVITEGEYNQKIEELNSSESSTETLNENVVGVGATLNPYPTKKKEVYESAFNKFLGEEKDEMEEGKEEVEEYGMKYEEPVGEAKEDLEEDKRTDAEEEGYQDGFKDALKDAKDAITKLRKELKEEEMEEGLNEDARTDAEEEGYQDGFKDALKDALDAIKGLKKELKEEDIEEMGMRYEEPVKERVTKKEKEEDDMRNKGGESAQTRETERMKSLGRK
jgi:flagellar hook-basal body complex protein FliE